MQGLWGSKIGENGKTVMHACTREGGTLVRAVERHPMVLRFDLSLQRIDIRVLFRKDFLDANV